MRISRIQTVRPYSKTNSLQNARPVNNQSINFKGFGEAEFQRLMDRLAKGIEPDCHVVDSLCCAFPYETPKKVEILLDRIKKGYEEVYEPLIQDFVKTWEVKVPKS